MRHRRWFISLAACLLLFSSCSRVDLYSDLSEEDTNEIMVLLAEHGIEAEKKKEIRQNEVFFAVQVIASEMARARSLLLRHNLPRRKELGLTGVYKEKGLIPTPDEQKARYLLAVKGEIINSLERIPAVLDADVVLNVPTQDEFASKTERERKRPTASAVVKAKPSLTGEAGVTEAKIQQFVANAVEGLHPRDVAVIITHISTSQALQPGDVRTLAPMGIASSKERQPSMPPEEELLGLEMTKASKQRLKLYFLLFFLLLVILSTGLIISIVQASRMRRDLQRLQPAAGEHPALEGEVLEESAEAEMERREE